MALLAPSAETFRQFLSFQDFFVFFVTVYVGAGLIANDRRANALQIYLSKPLTRAEYVLGKMAILMTFLLMVTWLPAIMLLLVQVAFAGSFTFLQEPSVSVPGDYALLVRGGHDGVGGHAGAVVALEQQPVRRHHVRRVDLFQSTPCLAS